MSQAVVLPVPDVTSIAVLLEGIAQLGLAVKQMSELRDSDGAPCKVDYVLTNEVGDKIGLRESENGEVSFVVTEPAKPTVKQTLDRVRQAYARLKIVGQMKQQGYKTVKEEKLADGSIRLVVRRW